MYAHGMAFWTSLWTSAWWLRESGLGLFVPIGDRAVQDEEVQTVVNGQPTP
jgi:hypothetical protein